MIPSTYVLYDPTEYKTGYITQNCYTRNFVHCQSTFLKDEIVTSFSVVIYDKLIHTLTIIYLGI